MNNLILTGIAGAVVVVGAVGAYSYARRQQFQKQIAAATEQIEGELQFEDVVSYFRSLNLDAKLEAPFVAKVNSDLFKEFTKGILTPKKGYNVLMLGTYNGESEEIHNPKFIYSKGWSEKLTNSLGSQDMVMLI